MKTTASLASVALVAFVGSVAAQESPSRHNSPGYAEEIDKKITAACPSAMFGPDDASNIACATIAWQAAYDIAKKIADHLTQEAGKSISNFDAGINKGILLICEMGANRMDAEKNTLDLSKSDSVLSYLKNSHAAAQECMAYMAKVESNIHRSVEPAASKHVADLLFCQIDPEQCPRPQEFNL